MNITNRTAKQFRESLDFLTTSYGEGDVPVGSRKLPSELALAVMTNKERLDSILGLYSKTLILKLKEFSETEGGKSTFKSDAARKEFELEMENLLGAEINFACKSVSEQVIMKIPEIEEWVLSSVKWLIKGYDPASNVTVDKTKSTT
jgi:hypothetical protein